jgi:hypothetical protein
LTEVPDGVFLLETGCPHDWLLPQCSAVVHHGGAGTTAAGLKAGAGRNAERHAASVLLRLLSLMCALVPCLASQHDAWYLQMPWGAQLIKDSCCRGCQHNPGIDKRRLPHYHCPLLWRPGRSEPELRRQALLHTISMHPKHCKGSVVTATLQSSIIKPLSSGSQCNSAQPICLRLNAMNPFCWRVPAALLGRCGAQHGRRPSPHPKGQAVG